MKKVLIATLAATMLAVPSAALATDDGHEYGQMPGFDQSLEQTCNAGHGGFDFLGPDSNRAGGVESRGSDNAGLAEWCRSQ